jgi:hypothetical protein
MWLGESLILRGRRERKFSEKYTTGSLEVCAVHKKIFS